MLLRQVCALETVPSSFKQNIFIFIFYFVVVDFFYCLSSIWTFDVVVQSSKRNEQSEFWHAPTLNNYAALTPSLCRHELPPQTAGERRRRTTCGVRKTLQTGRGGYWTHSEHRFPAPSSKGRKEGCRKPVLGVWVVNRQHQAGVQQRVKAQELCESRGGRPGPPSLINLRFLWT